MLLQNLVRYAEECSPSKIGFWSNFIDLYYRGNGGSVQCCATNGCNVGTDERFTPPFPVETGVDKLTSLPAELPGASLASFLQQTPAYVPSKFPISSTNNFQVRFSL